MKFLILFTLILSPTLSSANTCLGLFLKDEPLIVNNVKGVEVIDISVEFKENEDFSQHPSTLLNLSKIRGVSARIVEEKLHKNVRTVLYPASGFEAGAAFVLFPEADLVIGVDGHNVMTTKISPIVVEQVFSNQEDFTVYSDVDRQARDSNILAAQIGNLQQHIPRLRLHRAAQAVDENGSVHGWIDFDSGEGTPLRRYVHVKDRYDAYSPWLSPLLKNGFDALIIKGSMEIFSGDPRRGGGELVGHLQNNHGVVVDADGKLWEDISYSYERYAKARAAGGRAIKPHETFKTEDGTVYFTDIRLGYDYVRAIRSGVKLIKFD